MRYLVDTNVLVDVTRGSSAAADYLDSLDLPIRLGSINFPSDLDSANSLYFPTLF